MRTIRTLLALLAMAVVAAPLAAQDYNRSTFRGLSLREIGPALTSGRISDLAINPENPSEYYVAVASGNVWKTENGGVTFEPIFDGQGSYSIGVVTLDPSNPHVVWVGTGENNAQRSVAYGDGVYKSEDGGKSWEHMGLEESEHIGKILIDPRDSDVVWVASTTCGISRRVIAWTSARLRCRPFARPTMPSTAPLSSSRTTASASVSSPTLATRSPACPS